MNCRNVTACALVFLATALTRQQAVAQDLLCQVKVLNSLRGAVIEQLVTQFYFSNNTQYINDEDVSIGFGEAGYNDSNSNSKCVKRASTVIRFTYGGQTYSVAAESGDAPSGQCWTFIEYELAPAYTVSQEKLNAAKTPTERLAARLKLIAVDPGSGEKVRRDCIVVEDFDEYVAKLRAAASNGAKQD